MSRLLFDIETNGLLDAMDRIHCIVTYDLNTGEMVTYRNDERGAIRRGMEALAKAEEIVGHNILGFDIPALKFISPSWSPGGKVTDTLVMSRMVYADLKDRDFEFIKKYPGKFPGQLAGRHSLESWGHRLGMHKGDYAKIMKERGLDPWAELNDEMVDYCENDVLLNVKLLRRIENIGPSARALDIEHIVWGICLEQESFGCRFDEEAAGDLYAELSAERSRLEAELKTLFEPWWKGRIKTLSTGRKFIEHPHGATVRKVKKVEQRGFWMHYTEGAQFNDLTMTEFNPSSRDHIADRLIKVRGWKPTAFTNSSKPQVDESILAKLKYPEAKKLTRYLLVQKRIGQLAEGKQAWLKSSKKGRIHGRVNPMGTTTSRASHSHPNLGQVPACGAPWGAECRRLFMATEGWEFVGADASGLELRCLAHYMARYDRGEYADIVLTGDIHWATVLALGLVPPGTKRDKENKQHEKYRNMAKTFIYAFLYGAGNQKLGSIVGKGAAMGKKLRDRFLSGLPALGKLVAAVQKKAGTGELISLDGRVIPVRSAHSALNFLLQGAGAVIMKQAMVNFHEAMAVKGHHHGRDYRQVLWVHDEFQVECRPGLSAVVGSTMVEAIQKVTDDFQLRCPLDGEFKVGTNWSETH